MAPVHPSKEPFKMISALENRLTRLLQMRANDRGRICWKRRHESKVPNHLGGHQQEFIATQTEKSRESEILEKNNRGSRQILSLE
jgi:hypothetical protein